MRGARRVLRCLQVRVLQLGGPELLVAGLVLLGVAVDGLVVCRFDDRFVPLTVNLVLGLSLQLTATSKTLTFPLARCKYATRAENSSAGCQNLIAARTSF